MRSFARRLTGVLLLLLGAATAFSQTARREPRWWGPVAVDPLRFASLPLSFEEAVRPAPGRWKASFPAAYFNLWSGSWHTGIIHREFGLRGKPLSPWELRTLERRHPNDAIYRLDVEGWVGRLALARGLGHGLGLVVDVPWIQIGAPRWDAISERFHQVLGLSMGDRGFIANGQTLVYIRGLDRDRVIEGWRELNGSGLGDARLTVNGSLGRWLGGRHTWALSLEAPTGGEGTLRGSGGWDLGARWFGSWRLRTATLRLAAGYTRLSTSGTFLGAERSDTWHVLGAYLRPVGAVSTLMAGLSFHTSPLSRFTDAKPGDPSLVFDLGWGFDLGEGYRLEAAVIEDVTAIGTAPDIVFQVRLVVVPGRGARR
jgi:hypothetical protein